MNIRTAAILLLTITKLIIDVRADYILDDSVGLGRMFDGIGGLSGGGVSYMGGAIIVHA